MCRIDILPTDPYCCTVYIMCICLPVVREWRSMKALRCTLQIVLFLCICTFVTSEDQCNLTLKTGKYAWGDKVVQEYILIYISFSSFFNSILLKFITTITYIILLKNTCLRIFKCIHVGNFFLSMIEFMYDHRKTPLPNPLPL